MFVSNTRSSYLQALLGFIILALVVFALGSLLARAQTPESDPAAAQTGITTSTADQPLLREYRGVSLGMAADEARRKLGEPVDKSDRQDFYTFSETESAQIFYDTSHKVMAVSVHYSGDLSGAPTPKSLFGADVAPLADGSVYRLVRYERAGYWVSYSRTAGDSPVVTVSMQKAGR